MKFFPQRKTAPKNVNSEVNSVRFISFQYIIHIDLIFYFAYVFLLNTELVVVFFFHLGNEHVVFIRNGCNIRIRFFFNHQRVHAKFNFAVIWLSNPIDRVIEKPLHPFFVDARMRLSIKCFWLAFKWNRCWLMKQDSILLTYSSNKLYSTLI